MIILFLFQVAFILVACRKMAEVQDVFNQSWPLLAYFVILFLLTLCSPTNHHWFSDIEFFFMTSIVSAFLFVMLLKTCRNDVEIIESSVSIYNVGKITS